MRKSVVLLASMAATLLLASGVALAVTKVGSNGPDTLRGTNGADNLSGKGANDVLFSLGSPLTYSSAASRELVTAIVLSGSSVSSRNAPAIRSVPSSCSFFERFTWATMASGAFVLASSKEAYLRTQNTTQYTDWLLISIRWLPLSV
jgi:Ca2+-binding RTX toxin-like protein